MAPFVSKRSGTRSPEVEALAHHWPQLCVSRVCALSCSWDLALAGVTYPLWLLKTQEQAAGGPTAFRAARLIIDHQGFRGLYRGAVFGTLGLLPGHCAYLCTYEWAKHSLRPWIRHEWSPALAAAAAESVYLVLTTPVEVVTVRLQSAGTSAPLLARGAVVAEFRALWRQGGLQRLYRGGLLTLASALPESSVWWLVYENCKASLRRREAGPAVAWFCSAAAACTMATVLVNPVDVLKTRVQAGTGTPRIANLRLQEPYWRLFTRGLGPRLLSSAIAGIPESGAYEAIMRHAKRP
mmetsp:Transcript_46091/g.128138  ORF Transcript_46091/g.128138 Transcript_46091/m.128138 type:complete len:295 (-) Transcript_46091:232-1116(-)